MSHSHEDIHKTIRSYVMVFAALLVLTGVTVGVSYVHLESIGERVALALVVAGIKASLVALIFMHLKAERPMIYYALGLTAVLLVVAFGLPLWAESDKIVGTRYRTWDAGVEAPAMPGHEAAAGEHGGGH
ncbi:MAG: cytochrome C oxidase subunit IV family protein [Vicinamibacterales bacterium]|nr:cytochrome C oxidase subunit IV family protein [Vicinamibacterales bacterium]